MSNEEDECDSSSPFTVASQSDVTSFLHAQAAKITGVNSGISDDDDDDDNSMDGSLSTRFAQVSSKKINKHSKSYLSQSCFAAIASSSSGKQNPLDDLTELKWLNTFKLKEFKDKIDSNELKERSLQQTEQLNNDKDRISQLSNELKSYDNENININSISFGLLIFLALYSKCDDKQLPWSLTIKQLYEYIRSNIRKIVNRRGWKNLLKQALNTIPCFVKTKCDTLKSRPIWTIDPYYRPLLTKAYLSSPSFQPNKTLSDISTNGNDEKQTVLDTNDIAQSVVSNFAPKATVKTKALPRLYERLCEEKPNDEADSNNILKHQRSSTSGRKRPRSISSLDHYQSIKDNDDKYLSSSLPCTTKLNKRQKIGNLEPKTSTPNRRSSIVTPCPSVDHTYFVKQTIEHNDSEDDERDSSSIRTSIITTRSQSAARGIQHDSIATHRRKSSPPKKRSSLILPSHRANTRISRRIIEQDLKLLRQANDVQPLDLSINPSDTITTQPGTSIEGVLDLSLSR